MLNTVLLCAVLLAANPGETVTVTGTLRTGVVAIGGETTGTTINTKVFTWELDLGKDAELQKAAEGLNGKQVKLTGMLEHRAGVKERWIVTVETLHGANADDPAPFKPQFFSKAFRKDTGIRFEGDDSAIWHVTSEFGKDSAFVTRLGDNWPKQIVVRLHLNGLEFFRVSTNEVSVRWGLLSSPNRRINTLSKGEKAKKEWTITASDPYFTEVKVADRTDKFFEVPLPAKLFEGNPDQVMLEWSDFQAR